MPLITSFACLFQGVKMKKIAISCSFHVYTSLETPNVISITRRNIGIKVINYFDDQLQQTHELFTKLDAFFMEVLSPPITCTRSDYMPVHRQHPKDRKK